MLIYLIEGEPPQTVLTMLVKLPMKNKPGHCNKIAVSLAAHRTKESIN